MNKKLFIALFIAVAVFIVIAGGYLFFRGGENQTSQELDINNPSSAFPPGFELVPETVDVPDDGGLELQDEGVELQDDVVVSETVTKEINMVSGNLFFTPKNLTLVENQPVKITFQNTGTHTFTIDELGVNTSIRGSSETVQFTPTKTGVFQYYCAVPGHRAGGMFGTLTVE